MSRWYSAAAYPDEGTAAAAFERLNQSFAQRPEIFAFELQGMDLQHVVGVITEEVQTLELAERKRLVALLGGGTRRLLDAALIEAMFKDWQEAIATDEVELDAP
ncbi:MAG TPA: hypothetical protein VFB50_22860 [Chloroflexota bacterium]|nr:hypothetical protein [Chloroflexota bacterium]